MYSFLPVVTSTAQNITKGIVCFFLPTYQKNIKGIYTTYMHLHNVVDFFTVI